MKESSIIILISSIGLIIMGLVIINSKYVIKKMIGDDKSVKSRNFIKKNAYVNILVGVLGFMLGIIDNFITGSNIVIIILFISMIFLSSIIQSNIRKKFR